MKTIFAILALCLSVATAPAEIDVFSAASMTDALRALAARFEADGGEKVRFNFASSGTLARQIDAGAPADLFVSANADWMDWLAKRSAIKTDMRFDLAANTLVLIAPPGSTLKFDGSIAGRVAVGDFKGVPAGMYTESALKHMGWLEAWRPHLVMSSNVRTALLYVERGEVAAGVVYATDAKASGKVEVIGTFPPESHDPIVYPIAACSTKKAALEFLDFLKSPEAQAILSDQGFSKP